MHYIIDGYNLLFKLTTETNPLEQARNDIITTLREELQRFHFKATIIFDNSQKTGSHFPQRFFSHNLEIIYAPEDHSADEYILEWLQSRSHKKNECVVTSDRALALKVRQFEAKTQSIEDFLFFLSKKRKRPPKKRLLEKEELQESHANIKRLLKIFEEHLLD